MIEHFLTNIIGYAALGLFGVAMYESYRHRKNASEILDNHAKYKQQKKDVETEIKKLDEAVIDKQKAYESAKGKVYEILSKRNPPGSNSNSSDESGRSGK